MFVLVGWVLFQPSTFTQKLITFGVAAALMVWVVSVVDGSQRRSLDRLQRRMELQREVAIAQAQAAERGRVLDAFLGSFVVNVNGSIGDYPPYPNYELPNAPRGPMPSDGRSHAVRPPVRRPDPRDD